MPWLRRAAMSIARRSLFTALGCLAACSEPSGTSAAADLVVVHSPAPVGAPGSRLRDTIVVETRDSANRPLAGRVVVWTVTAGGGNVEPSAERTDFTGRVSALWTLGASGTNSLVARTADGPRAVFTSEATAFRVDELDSDYDLGCGLVGGALWCWGYGPWGSAAPSLYPAVGSFGEVGRAPGLVDSARAYRELAVNSQTVCVLDRAGAPWCASESAPDVVQVPGVPPLRGLVRAQASTGNAAFCALAQADSLAWCFGNGVGAPVARSPALIALVAGDTWYCGTLADSTAVCWGDGPLGDGMTTSSADPVPVSGAHHFAELASGADFVCGREAGGDVFCWGRDPRGGSDVPTPTLAIGGADHVSARTEFAMIAGAGQVTVGIGPSFSPDPSYLTSLSGLDGLSVGSPSRNSTSCVRLVDGEVYCWDEFWYGTSTIPYYATYSPIHPVLLNNQALARPQ